MPLSEQGAMPDPYDPALDYRTRSKGSIPTLLEKLCNGNDTRRYAVLDEVRDLSDEQRFQVTKHLFWWYDSQVMEKPSNAYIWLIPFAGSCYSLLLLMVLPFLVPM